MECRRRGSTAFQSRPKFTAEVRSAEDKAGHSTSKGSAAAREQSAAAYNVREGTVPPVGTANIGTERGVLDDKAAQGQSFTHIQHGTATYTTRRV